MRYKKLLLVFQMTVMTVISVAAQPANTKMKSFVSSLMS